MEPAEEQVEVDIVKKQPQARIVREKVRSAPRKLGLAELHLPSPQPDDKYLRDILQRVPVPVENNNMQLVVYRPLKVPHTPPPPSVAPQRPTPAKEDTLSESVSPKEDALEESSIVTAGFPSLAGTSIPPAPFVEDSSSLGPQPPVAIEQVIGIVSAIAGLCTIAVTVALFRFFKKRQEARLINNFEPYHHQNGSM